MPRTIVVISSSGTVTVITIVTSPGSLAHCTSVCAVAVAVAVAIAVAIAISSYYEKHILLQRVKTSQLHVFHYIVILSGKSFPSFHELGNFKRQLLVLYTYKMLHRV